MCGLNLIQLKLGYLCCRNVVVVVVMVYGSTQLKPNIISFATWFRTTFWSFYMLRKVGCGPSLIRFYRYFLMLWLLGTRLVLPAWWPARDCCWKVKRLNLMMILHFVGPFAFVGFFFDLFPFLFRFVGFNGIETIVWKCWQRICWGIGNCGKQIVKLELGLNEMLQNGTSCTTDRNK